MRSSLLACLGPIQLALALSAAAFGLLLLALDGGGFRDWIREDGLAEWWTAALLALASGWSAGVAAGQPDARARRTWLVIAALMLFGALEEVSWGQRIFGWESPAWFLEHNAQRETNVHNLRFFGLKLNRWVFGKGLTVVLLGYAGLLSWLYHRPGPVRAWIDSRALPVTRLRQAALWLCGLAVLRLFLPLDPKVNELGELVGASVFLWILLDPVNPRALPLALRDRPALAPALAMVCRAFSPGTRMALVVGAANLLAFALLRLAFLATFRDRAPDAPVADVLEALAIGLRFDLRLAALLVAPLLALSWLAPLNPARSRRARALWTSLFVGAAAAWSLLYAADFAHFAWVDARLDVSALEYAFPLDTAARVVWESYPIAWILAGATVFLAFYGRLVAALLSARPSLEGPGASLRLRVPLDACVGLAGILAVVGSLDGYPLRWSRAFFTPEPFVSALGLNPVLYLIDSWPYRDARHRYDLEHVERAHPEVARYLGLEPESGRLDFRRCVPGASRGARPNVVVIVLESLGANKTGLFGNPLEPTPRIDAIARESLQFRRFFVASRGTARAIFSLLTGIPDVTRRASRNPQVVDQHLILEDLEAYQKLYFYTGDLVFGNLRGLIQNNVSNVRVFEEKDYASPRNDGWGISDLHLFEEANAVFRRTERPFFAILQTSGNHRPYTIPDDRRGFEIAPPRDRRQLEAAGLRSDEEYNALRFMDHSVGWFLETAKREPYFDDTIFVLLGDHGSRGSGGSPLQRIGLAAIHVPLLIYAPAMLEPRVEEEVTSSLDVFPTLARLLRAPHVNSTLGRDALQPRRPEQRYVFSDAGLVDGEFFFADGRLFRYASDAPDRDVAARFPERLAEMQSRWEGMRETALYLMHHNQKGAATDTCGSPGLASAR